MALLGDMRSLWDVPETWLTLLRDLQPPQRPPVFGEGDASPRGMEWLDFIMPRSQRSAQDWVPLFTSKPQQPFSRPVVKKPKAQVLPPTRGPSPSAPAGAPASAGPAAATGSGKPTVQRWASMVGPLTAEAGVPMNVALGVMDIESGGDPGAESAMNYSKGKPIGKAQGLMQVMPGNFRPEEDPKDPETNIRRGLDMLAERFKRFGSWDKAAASYFGAADAQGNPTTAKDVNGVSGLDYVQRFKNASARYATP